MKSIHFQSLDDLLAFLMQCENYGLLGDNPENYEFLHVRNNDGLPQYAIEFDDELWPQADSTASLFAGTIQNEPLNPGYFDKVHVNELLLALPLQQQSQSRGYVPSVLLACKARQRDNIAELVQVLYAAWREIPKGDEEESIFRFSFGKTSWLTVEVPSIHSGFVFREFQETLSSGFFRDKVTGRDISLSPVVVFLPAWSGREDCLLFVESGYSYPKPIEFSALYHPAVSAQRDLQGNILPMEIDHVVLLERDPGVDVDGGGLWVHSKSFLLGSSVEDGDTPEEEQFVEFSRSSDIYDLQIQKFDRWPEFIQSLPIPGDDEKLQIKLQIGDTSQSVGHLHELQARIGRLQRSIEDLESRRARLQTFEDEDYIAIFVFEQPDPEEISAHLSGFLKRPLSELARFQYLRARMPDGPGFEHYIISDIRMPVSQILATPCERAYLCEGRWWDWGLNLFLKADTSLNFPLNEPGLIKKVRDTLEGLSGTDRLESGYLLAEPALGGKGNTSPIHFRILLPPEGEVIRPLDELLFFSNELGTGTRSILETAITDFEVQARDHIVKADNETVSANEEFIARSETVISTAEHEWENVRSRAQSIVTEARMADAALTVTAEAYRDAPTSWVTFVERVHQLDVFLSKSRLDAFGRWFQSEETREAIAEKIRRLKIDVSQEIREMSERATERQQMLNSELDDLNQEVEEFERLLQSIQQHLTDTERLTKEFNAKATEAEEHLRKLDAEKNSVLESQKRTRAAQEIAETKLKELEADQDALRKKQETLSEFEDEVRRRTEENQSDVARFTENSESLFDTIADGKDEINKALDHFFRICDQQLTEGEKLLEDRKLFASYRKRLAKLSTLREADDDKKPGFFARLFGGKS